MWRINKLSIQNFKFFKDLFVLNINEKNLLLYGENGSGKSSIYWSLYTFFQSVYKEPTPDHALKYFIANNSENLRNKFSSQEEYSGIKVTFSENGREYTFEDSSERCNTHCEGDDFMKITSAASDFMNYKFLSTIFDFKNSEIPEIFHIFEKEVLPSLLFKPSPHFVHIDGTRPNGLQDDADYWWKYLRNTYTLLPKGRNPKYILATSPEMIRYKQLLEEFNYQFESYLNRLKYFANIKLQNEFGVNASIDFEYKGASIQKNTPTTEYNFSSKIIEPQVYIKANFEHENIEAARREIIHPRSFFNEAKLTCISLAIRMAIAEMKINAEHLGANILLIDDLLISLDMSNRMVVVDYLLKLTKRYQLLILTHDKTFYNLIKLRIDTNNRSDEWTFYQLYAIENTKAKFPCPLLLPSETLLDEAKGYFASCKYAACANTLRRDTESLLKSILPYDIIYSNNADNAENAEKPITLSQMINETYIYFKDIKLDVGLLKNLHFYREHLMNPMSHGDTRTEIYKYELDQIITDLIEIHSITLNYKVPLEHCNNKKEYRIKMSNDEKEYEAKFIFLEPWPILSYKEKQYFSTKIKIKIVWANYFTVTPDKATTYDLCNVYNKMCKALFRDDNAQYPNIFDVISEI